MPSGLDVVGLGVDGGQELVGVHGRGQSGPGASATAQEGATGHSEDASSPADEHGPTKLEAAKRNRCTHI